MKEGKLPDPKDRENEIDLGQKLQLDRDKEFQRRLKEAQGADYVEPETQAPTSSTSSSKASNSSPKGQSKDGKSTAGKIEKKSSSILDYIVILTMVSLWLFLFVFRNYPGLLGMQPKAPAPAQKEEEFTLEYK